jgi:hypothetical protein
MHPFSDLSGACQKKGACHNTATHSLKHGLVGVAAGNFENNIYLLADPMQRNGIYSLYSLWMLPHCLSVASKAPLRTRKGCMQLITSHDKKDYGGKTNGFGSHSLKAAELDW